MKIVVIGNSRRKMQLYGIWTKDIVKFKMGVNVRNVR